MLGHFNLPFHTASHSLPKWFPSSWVVMLSGGGGGVCFNIPLESIPKAKVVLHHDRFFRRNSIKLLASSGKHILRIQYCYFCCTHSFCCRPLSMSDPVLPIHTHKPWPYYTHYFIRMCLLAASTNTLEFHPLVHYLYLSNLRSSVHVIPV